VQLLGHMQVSFSFLLIYFFIICTLGINEQNILGFLLIKRLIEWESRLGGPEGNVVKYYAI
jgi:hypothetical protein